ncbi:MAG TPA: hypothetical protein VFQ88_14870 [Nevskiaceae bacterium]|nr:hypothetical protein [Nevskiaceae bacterium]
MSPLISKLGRRYGIAPQTARKWRRRESVADRSHRPHHLRCTLTPAQEVVATAVDFDRKKQALDVIYNTAMNAHD